MRPKRLLRFSLIPCCVGYLVLLFSLERLLSFGRNAANPDAGRKAGGAASVEQDCWVFHHLHKSGGMTIRRIMNPPKGDLNAKGEIVGYGTDEWRLGERFRSETLLHQLLHEKKYRIATGGYVGALRLSPSISKSCKFFTVFRHPINRVVSAYHYCRSEKHNWDPLCATSVLNSAEVSIVEFAKHWGNYAVRQMVMSYIPAESVLSFVDGDVGGTMGDRPATLYGVAVDRIPSWVLVKYYLQHGYRNKGGTEGASRTVQKQGAAAELADDDGGVGGGGGGGGGDSVTTFNDDEALSEWMGPIRRLLRYNYTAVGVVEEFDATMALFDSVGVIPGKEWATTYGKLGAANTNDAPETERGLVLRHALASEEVKKYLRLDILLYAHAVSVFHDMLRQHGIAPGQRAKPTN